MRILLALQRWLAGTSAVPLLFGIYVLPRIAMLFFSVQQTSDAAWYFNRAAALATGAGYSERGILTAYWPPGWPLTLAAIFTVSGASVLAVKVFNILCAVASGWFTLDLGRRLFSSELAGRASLLM